ncbi:MAG: two-component sensor histidine kinase, partial [Lachnospiraceae bacterium]
MKNLTKFINRFLIIMIVSVSIIMVVNIVLFIAYFSKYAVASAWSVARDVASVFEETDTEYTIPAEVYEMLAKDNAWAIYIDNDSMSVVWKTENLPLDVPLKYTISEISLISRGYLNSYSTFVAATETGLIVLGYPEEIYFTLQTPTWDYNFIKNIPANILFLIVVNSILIFIIYMCVSGQLIRSLKPIISGIISLP